ncbi:uncharacterized protein LOC110454190 [Mizuhopecten yessoensis]|uniref:uncharacterized protein LOC110454190 n=1 Tax=Mizuhopecten yessoensis TaxID=6573 RepID=UPI000B459DD9|nr:uncharacterized protein LOC110454190 [Mizuhopecten yessoensis]XP_021359242.1 uncharacterized protein LOC110454190 [Mizuhopecten yessoensis]
MGCTFTKVRDPSREADEKTSEVLSQTSIFTDYKKELECHTAPATRDIVEKCHLALSVSNAEEDDVISLHRYPPNYMDESESEMNIPPYHTETSDLRQDSSNSDLSSVTGKGRSSSRLSSRLSNFFRIGKRSKLNIQDELSSDGDLGRGNGNGDGMSSSEWDRPPTPSRQDFKKTALQRANNRMHSLSQRVATNREIHEDQALALIDDILERYEMSKLEIEDDGRSSSSSSSDGSIFPPTFNFRAFARPKAAIGTRNLAAIVPDPAKVSQDIGEFETEVEKLIDEQAVATRDYRNRQLRPGGARGPRLPSFSLQFQNPTEDSSSETVAEKGRRYSNYFANTVSRPQLIVPGLATADDRLMQWIVSQQRRDSEWR